MNLELLTVTLSMNENIFSVPVAHVIAIEENNSKVLRRNEQGKHEPRSTTYLHTSSGRFQVDGSHSELVEMYIDLTDAKVNLLEAVLVEDGHLRMVSVPAHHVTGIGTGSIRGTGVIHTVKSEFHTSSDYQELAGEYMELTGTTPQ